MRIILDMDDVLVDFIGAVCTLHGTTVEEVLPNWDSSEWSIVSALGKTLDKPFTIDDFWEPIHNAGAGWWAELQPKPWFAELMERVRNATNDWHIVTSPSRCTTCYDGKVRWLKQHFHGRFDRFAITPHKHIFAQPGVVLIDDNPQTVQRFKNEGGQAILFPSWGNELRFQLDDPLYVLAQIGV